MNDFRQQFIETRIKELQDSTDFVNNLLKCISGYAIVVGDFDGNIIVFNEGARQIFGFEPQEVVGLKNIEDFFPEIFVKAGSLHKLFDRLINEGEYLYELDRERKNGEVFPAESLLTLVQDNEGRLVGFVEIIQDITERKKKAAQLEKANKQLVELDKLKDNFLNIASHELRTPLTSIKSFAEILYNSEEDRATQKEFLGIINEESDRLIRMINDFLDISKIQAGRMQWKIVELSLFEIFQPAVKLSRPLIEKARLELTLDMEADLPHVLGDKDRLVQVITNLLGNSIKFTSEGGNITVKSWLEESKEAPNTRNMVIVSISDTGIGIAPENHARIFENFGQVGNILKDRPKGTGLGLPICKKIVEYFGGRIWVESQIGQGSTFLFSIPAVQQTDVDILSVCSEKPGDNRLTVSYV
jgi:PAS domain S-box-containing protein